MVDDIKWDNDITWDTPESKSLFQKVAEPTSAVLGTGAGIYAGIKAAHLIPKATGDIARRIAGVGTKSVKWLKQRGVENIFNPLKEQPDYIGTNLTSEIDDIVKGQIQSLDDYFAQTINSVKDRFLKQKQCLGNNLVL